MASNVPPKVSPDDDHAERWKSISPEPFAVPLKFLLRQIFSTEQMTIAYSQKHPDTFPAAHLCTRKWRLGDVPQSHVENQDLGTKLSDFKAQARYLTIK